MKTSILTYVLLGAATIGSASYGARDSRTRALGLRTLPQAQQVWSDSVYNIFEILEKGMNESAIRERLDGFAIALKTNPSFRAHIIGYAGRRSCRGEARTRAQMAKEYLTQKKGVEPKRIKIVDGGYREEWAVELWHGAKGATIPGPMLTIDPKEAKITKNCHLSRSSSH